MLFGCMPRQASYPVIYTVSAITDDETAAAFAEGQGLTDGVGKGDVGRIVSLDLLPATAENVDGVYQIPNKVRLILTVEAEATDRDGITKAGGMVLIPGKEICLHGRGVLQGICLSVCEKESAEALNDIQTEGGVFFL